MSPEDRARAYLAKCPPAVSGAHGHQTAFAVVCEVVNGFSLDEHQAFAVLQEWNAGCQPPWSDAELRHKINDAIRVPHAKPRGHKLTASDRRQVDRVSTPSPSRKSHPETKPAQPAYALTPPDELPQAMDDGARLLLRTVFRQGEGIRIAPARWSDEKQGELPDGGGVCLTREEWLRRLDRCAGDPNGIFSSSEKTGIYIAVNPYRVGCTKDADVSDYRHVLIEFDKESGLSPQAQYDLYVKSRIPCAALIYSGGDSCHAWVKIEAQSRQEYDERVKLLYAHFDHYGIDPANKNPGRLSRLPHCVRFDKRQELIALATPGQPIGCESFSAWQAELQTDGIGEVVTVEELDNFKPGEDPNTLLGSRWLCRGGSCLLIGPSGIGKSSLVLQLVIPWTLGKPSFGITPTKPLKVLIIQAENDTGDMAEMLQGIRVGLGIDAFNTEAEYELLKANLIFVRETSHTGHDFTEAVRRLIDRYRPDLVVFDPLLSFIGADISRQEVCSQFLRNWLNPIASATGVCWLCVHHTGKPSTDPKSKKHWKGADFAYSGLGSSELTNWTRAAMVLEEAGEGAFRLRFSKRGKRAGAVSPDGSPTLTLWLRYADKGIFWQQVEPPEESQTHKNERGGRENIIESIAGSNVAGFLVGCKPQGEGKNEIAARLEGWLATDQKRDVSSTSCKRIVELLVKNQKLHKTAQAKYVKGPNA